NLGANHGLLTGDTVTYTANGNPALGGLTDGRQYGVIYISDQKLELGAAFTASSTSVDLARDSIRFAGAHNLVEGDAVVYHNAGAFTVGGLTEGKRYLVHVVDAQTIKLVDPAHPLAAAQTFTGNSVAGNTITLTGHGFANGQAVTYRAPADA